MSTFHKADESIGEIGTLGDFWRWAMSDLLSNGTRGVFAEYIVGKLLGADFSSPRLEWDAYDLLYEGHRIEVKSSSYIQTWHTTNNHPHQTTEHNRTDHKPHKEKANIDQACRQRNAQHAPAPSALGGSMRSAHTGCGEPSTQDSLREHRRAQCLRPHWRIVDEGSLAPFGNCLLIEAVAGG